MSDKDGKTEKPTPKRLKDSREKGDIPKSSDLVPALSLFAFAVVFIPLWEYLAKQLIPFMTRSFERLYLYETIFNDLPKFSVQMLFVFGLLVFPFFLVSVTVGLLGNLAQVGLLFSTKVIKPNFKNIMPHAVLSVISQDLKIYLECNHSLIVLRPF